MNNLPSYDDIELEEQELENEENQLVLSQRENAQNMSNQQLQRYVTVTEEHPSLQAARIQSKLQQRLGPEYVSSRPGPGGGKVYYLEANKAVELAHEIFGHDSWSSEIVQFQEMAREKSEGGKWTISVMCTVKVTIRSGAFHQDCGFGNAENQRSIAAAMEKAYKEASTDALKRCLRLFGNAMGNCLYDKKHLSNIAKMKAPDPPFNPQTLKRAEGMENPGVSSTIPNISSTTKPNAGNSRSNNGATPPQSTVFSPQNVLPQKANGVGSHRREVNGTSSVLQNKTNAIDTAKQERLRLANLKREELLRKKVHNGNDQQTAIAANESLMTGDSKPALPYKVHFPEGDEFAGEFDEITSSQLNILSMQDSSNHTPPSKESTFVHDQNDHVKVKLSPSRMYNIGQQQPTFKRGGVIRSNDVESHELPAKRSRNF